MSKQKDLPTMERPTIEAVDEKLEKHQKAKAKHAKSKLALDAAAEEASVVLIEHEDKLEKDKEGNSVYRLDDGADGVEYVIPCRGSMRTRKPTKAKDDDGSGDLE